MKILCKIIVQFIITSVILYKEFISTNVSIVDILLHANDTGTDNIDIKNYMEFSFGNTFACEMLYRYTYALNSKPKIPVYEEVNFSIDDYLFSLRNPMELFSSVSSYEPVIIIRTVGQFKATSDMITYNNSLQFIHNTKFTNFYNKDMFDGNWHKIVVYYESGYAWIEFDCYKSDKQKLEYTFQEMIYFYPHRDRFEMFFYIFHGIYFDKFMIYDELPNSIQCKDVKRLQSEKGPDPELLKKNFTLNDYKFLLKDDCETMFNHSNVKHRAKKWESEYGLTTVKEECVESRTLVRGTKPCAEALIFVDEFDNFNEALWEHEIRIPLDTDDAEFVSYQDYPANCKFDGRRLILMPTLLDEIAGFTESSLRMGELNLGSNCTVLIDEKIECYRKAQYSRILPPVVSAKIRTKKSFSFRYGRIDVMAKLPKGDWIFPQIYLEPLISNYGTGGYKSGQMRIAYIRANEYLVDKNMTRIDGTRISGGVVLGVGELTRDRFLRHSLQAKHVSQFYHLYSMVWTNESIRFSFDGEEYGSIDGGFKDIPDIPHSHLWKRGDFMAPFDQEFYISLGVSVGGISDFPDGCKSGVRRQPKPWENTNPKGELKFWQNLHTWQTTWRKEKDISLKVDYVKVWAL